MRGSVTWFATVVFGFSFNGAAAAEAVFSSAGEATATGPITKVTTWAQDRIPLRAAVRLKDSPSLVLRVNPGILVALGRMWNR
ncbi:hypothetical protein GCM10010507_20080 [Streptomyces cinnamoneus]|uniref:Uncharacterized protein n=1 Tax=Streptomyces cinnamoneus TaxID=53446 RepID=A0A918TE96_STRCJ|nr:hypothetical protein GCM10010507_20080 [Streptomyces cinnamoneus]